MAGGDSGRFLNNIVSSARWTLLVLIMVLTVVHEVGCVDRSHLLFHDRSQGLVRVRETKVDARGKGRGHDTQLLFQSVDEDQRYIYISHKATSMYLCYNRKGKIKAKKAHWVRKRSGNRCRFREILKPDGHFLYESAHNPDWFLGFNRRGRPLKNSTYSNHKESSFLFQKDNKYSYRTRHYFNGVDVGSVT